MSKRLFYVFSVIFVMQNIVGCSTNPATGESQFTALMSPSQELQVGAQEHYKIIKQFGVYKDKKLQNYVTNVGRKVVQYTERPEVQYKFYLLDSPMVNAFALPGGYVYLTRGLLALANSEAEMASVLAHETGHITARHSAERYSRGVVTSLGAMILSSAVGNAGVSQALGVGSDLYSKSYSRGQESQADSLGIRYLARSGYSPKAMAGFLRNMQADSALEDTVDNRKTSNSTNYFSTHPATANRVSRTVNEASSYSGQGIDNHNEYLRMIDGLIYGDSVEQGFVRGNSFYHPQMGFKFSVPSGYKLINQPSQVIASSANGSIIIFDIIGNKNQMSPASFIRDVWMKGKEVSRAENININGMRGATSSFKGYVGGKSMNVRLVAIDWGGDSIARFQIAMPLGMSAQQITSLRKSTYSFARMSEREKRSLRPYRIRVVVAKGGDSVATLSRRMAQDDYKERRFRVLNGLGANGEIVANRLYKIVVD